MKSKLLITVAIMLFWAGGSLAQNGGKAEPNRIKFTKGKSIATVSDKISGGLQAEYAFGAKKGQTVTIKISSVPKGNYCAFKVINAFEAPDYTSESDINYNYTFSAPYTGEYLIWVNFRPAGKVKSAAYSLTLSIK